MSADPTALSSWGALSRPSIALASASAARSSGRADARRMGSRVKPGHDEFGCVFNHLKFFSQTLFPIQYSFLYRSDELDRPHAPDFFRNCGGAFARAEAGRGARKTRKCDEQFCCRSASAGLPGQWQSQGSGRADGKPQRAAPRLALGSASRTAKACSPPDRPRERPVPADARNRADVPGAARRPTRARAALATGGSGCEGRAP